MASPVKLVLVDASIVLRRTISIKLINDTALQLVSAVGTPMEAGEKIKFFKPEVVVLGIDKIDALNLRIYENFIKETALPLVIITNESAALLHLVHNVRTEFVARPPLADMRLVETTAEEVVLKIKKMKNIPLPIKSAFNMEAKNLLKGTEPISEPQNKPKFGERSVYQIQGKNIVKPPVTNSKYGGLLIAIGSSTGGTEALYALLTRLPQDMPPILIVQHMPPVFTKLYAERLDANCKFEVREAKNGDTIYPGLALVAPGDRQMGLVRRGGKLAVECVRTDKVGGHCPAVDLLFETVAATMGKNAIGIILTGMGKDGAQGMVQMHNKGAFTIGQNQESSVVYGMPKVAYELGGVDIQSTPELIPDILLKALKERVK